MPRPYVVGVGAGHPERSRKPGARRAPNKMIGRDRPYFVSQIIRLVTAEPLDALSC